MAIFNPDGFRLGSLQAVSEMVILFLFLKIITFIFSYLAVPGLSCGMRDL